MSLPDAEKVQEALDEMEGELTAAEDVIDGLQNAVADTARTLEDVGLEDVAARLFRAGKALDNALDTVQRVLLEEEDLVSSLEPEEGSEPPTDTDLEDNAVIQETRKGYSILLEGKYLGNYKSWKQAWDHLISEMNKTSVWTDIYYVNERGNVTLYDAEGNEIGSWV